MMSAVSEASVHGHALAGQLVGIAELENGGALLQSGLGRYQCVISR
jgi:hypothetical protein